LENQIEKKGKKSIIYMVWSHKEKKRSEKRFKGKRKMEGSTRGGGGGWGRVLRSR
jgi:hypothetical protein